MSEENRRKCCVRIFPSLMCFDWARVGVVLREVEKAGADGIHCDIMDGSFVPNFTMGPDIVRAIRKLTDLPIDCHLMCWRPELHIEQFRKAGADIISVHAEATVHLQRTLDAIRKSGASPAVAFNPHTPLECLRYVSDDVDMALLMMVNPGFAGQKLIPAALGRITQCRQILDAAGRREASIQVDGNVSFQRAPEMVALGADVLVAGTSSVFAPNVRPGRGIAKLRAACQGRRRS